MRCLMDDRDLAEADPVGKDLVHPAAVRPVPYPDHRELTCRHEVAALEGARLLYAVGDLRARHFEDGSGNQRLYLPLWLRHPPDDDTVVGDGLLVPHEVEVREGYVQRDARKDDPHSLLLLQGDAG